jgi:hypothetical protein
MPSRPGPKELRVEWRTGDRQTVLEQLAEVAFWDCADPGLRALPLAVALEQNAEE